MLVLIVLLVIIPLILGLFVSHLAHSNQSDFSTFWFAMGFLVMVGEFAVICYPAIFLNISFHLVCYTVFGVYTVECLCIIIWAVKTKRFRKETFFTKDALSAWLRSPAFWVMVIICLLQILRLLIAAPLEMRDSKSYSALIIDIIQSDQLFRINPENGFPLKSVLDMPLKFTFSPWYAFIAMLARISHVHPLIISNTVLPPYLLLLHYVTLYALGSHLFKQKKESALAFTALCAFIYEITLSCHTPTMIKLVWPLWGKGALSMTVVPAVLVLYMMYITSHSQKSNKCFLIVFILLVITGCSMSTMAALELPLELGVLGLIWAIRSRAARPMVYSIISCIPAVFYVVAYYCLSSL